MAFQKGQSGNPSGRPADKLWRDALMLALKRPAEDGRTYLTRIAEQCVLAADSGDMQAVKEIGDRIDGKAVQAIATDPESGPLQVIFVQHSPKAIR